MLGVSPFGYLCSRQTKSNVTMGKSTHFFGQLVYGQLIKSLDHEKIIELSRKNDGEKYIKSFTGFTHLLTMLYAVIMRFDSLREIEAAMTASATLHVSSHMNTKVYQLLCHKELG